VNWNCPGQLVFSFFLFCCFVRFELVKRVKVVFECYGEWCGSLSSQLPLTTPGSRHVNNLNQNHHCHHQPVRYGRNEEARRAVGITHRISNFILMDGIFTENVQSSTRGFTLFYMTEDLGLYYTYLSN
jgi:hypothetical protein